MWELFAPSFLYNVLKDGLRFVRGRRRSLTPAEVVQLRQQWKPTFEEKLYKFRRDGLSSDVIIHDVKRLNEYPKSGNEGRGISAWFRVGLMGTYHGGILAGLMWEELVALPDDGWRIADYAAGEEGDLKAILIGEIPYERIESVDWDGDEYYGYPHIYCHFDGHRGQPYERIVYMEQRIFSVSGSPDRPYYVDVAPAKQVRRATARYEKTKRPSLWDRLRGRAKTSERQG